MTQLLRTYGFSAAATIACWAVVAVGSGATALAACVALTVLEVAVSFDNAVVNAKLLRLLSPWWQMFFLTVGIFIAVFVVRFALPVAIVAATSGNGFGAVVDMSLQQPELYAAELHKAMPAIASFGLVFLGMIALSFFLDEAKQVHWLGPLEARLSRLGRFDNVSIFAMLLIIAGFTMTVPGDDRLPVLLAALAALTLTVGLDLFNAAMEKDDDAPSTTRANAPKHVKGLVGMAAFFVFMRLEVLDASFSFDGVIGAFAITTDVVVIMLGLAAGAVWVRSITVHLVRTGALETVRYLEHGAHWAIAGLAGVMGLKLYHVELPEWFVGAFGLVLIGLSVVSSVRHRRRTQEASTWPKQPSQSGA